jgi:hypothetical protein
MKSGVSLEKNIFVEIYDPPSAKVLVPAKFTFVKDTPLRNSDGTLSIPKYYETYSNLTWFNFPKEYTTRRFITYFLPETFDSKGSNVTIKIIKGYDTSFVKFDEVKNLITIDK